MQVIEFLAPLAPGGSRMTGLASGSEIAVRLCHRDTMYYGGC